MAVRIISGTHRGRKIEVADALGLRPTPDRVRETLFNWLQSITPGAHCLDLFAGSGALGLEALSRGASKVVAIESNRKVFTALEKRAKDWDLDQSYTLLQQDALSWLDRFTPQSATFDCIFLDPPFQLKCLEDVIERIRVKRCLRDDGVCYIERPVGQDLPASLTVVKERKAGSVLFGLYKFS